MTIKFWAARNNKKVGPFATRLEAEVAGQSLFPKKLARRHDVISIGYGEFGPSFDIQYVEMGR